MLKGIWNSIVWLWEESGVGFYWTAFVYSLRQIFSWIKWCWVESGFADAVSACWRLTLSYLCGAINVMCLVFIDTLAGRAVFASLIGIPILLLLCMSFAQDDGRFKSDRQRLRDREQTESKTSTGV